MTSKRVHFRLTEQEYANLQKLAENAHLTVPQMAKSFVCKSVDFETQQEVSA